MGLSYTIKKIFLNEYKIKKKWYEISILTYKKKSKFPNEIFEIIIDYIDIFNNDYINAMKFHLWNVSIYSNKNLH